MIKINPTTYVELFKDYPDMRMELSGWDWEIKYYLFGLVSIVKYTKKLFR